MTVFVVPYSPHWVKAFEQEAKAIRRALPDVQIVLHHIGSTAIPGILAKPIIDILGVVDDLEALDQRSARMGGLKGNRQRRLSRIPGRGMRLYEEASFSSS
jgi:GrpB-like predicted nucleotidyltransferase (UPF0157 family)